MEEVGREVVLGGMMDERPMPSLPDDPTRGEAALGLSRALIGRFAHDGTTTRNDEAPSVISIIISLDPLERMSFAPSRYIGSLNSVEDFRVALLTVAGLRIARQLTQSSLSTALTSLCDAPYVFNFRFGVAGGG